MSALFRKSPPQGFTYLVVDIENGSVASALVHVAQPTLGERATPKLFAEHRAQMPLLPRVTGHALLQELLSALETPLAHTTQAAAYIRKDPEQAYAGELQGAVVFLGAPWSASLVSDGTLRWEFEKDVIRSLETQLGSRIPPHTIEFHPFARAAAYSLNYLVPKPTLLLSCTGEIIELTASAKGRVMGRSTIPFGAHTFLRTLMSHGALTEPEARSSLKLALGDTHPYREPLNAALESFAHAFVTGATPLVHGSSIDTVLILAPQHLSTILATGLQYAGSSVFPQGGVAHIIEAGHLGEHVITHEDTYDVALMLESMFINTLKQTKE